MPTVSLDPAQTAGIRRRVNTEFKKRLYGAQQEVIALVNAIQTKAKVIPDAIQVNKTVYEWLIDSFGRKQANIEIERIINRWLQTSGNERDNFFSSYIEDSYRKGSITSAMRVQLLAGQAGYEESLLQQLEAIQVINSFDYQQRLNVQFTNAFAEMKGFSQSTIDDISRVISSVITGGKSPRQAQREIKKRFHVANARAERIARTEVNRSNSLARLEQNKQSRDKLGINVQIVHRSALKFDATRKTHGLRHGTIHTIEDQAAWWDEGTNRINCLCSSAEVVLNKEGKPFDGGLIPKFESQRIAHYGK